MSHAITGLPSQVAANKRRRHEEVYQLSYCRKTTQVLRNIQNVPPPGNSFLEEKSIAALIYEQKMKAGAGHNPYEVVRKPPPKRKKVEEHCFVNDALNISQPEKLLCLNPYEVQRIPECPAQVPEKGNYSFVNLALDLKAGEAKPPPNPFEIVRPVVPVVQQDPEPRRLLEGIENSALDTATVVVPRAIAVPFTPTINHRIDFSQLTTPEPPGGDRDGAVGQETPTMLLSKLAFSPQSCATPKRLFGKSLSTISEEAVDIDQELDCYQLQLENSINEAKLNNRKYFTSTQKKIPPTAVETRKCEATEDDAITGNNHINHVAGAMNPDSDERSEADDSFDVTDIDSGNYQPFKRAYTRPLVESVSQQTTSNHAGMLPPPTVPPQPKTDGHEGLKAFIRRSVRRLTKPKGDAATTNKPKVDMDGGESKKWHTSEKLISSIRKSMRKRKIQTEDQPQDSHDVSVIIDDSRSVFKEQGTSKVPKVQKVAPPGTTTTSLSAIGAETTSLLRSSVRRGKNQFMKNVLHKSAVDYNL